MPQKQSQTKSRQQQQQQVEQKVIVNIGDKPRKSKKKTKKSTKAKPAPVELQIAQFRNSSALDQNNMLNQSILSMLIGLNRPQQPPPPPPQPPIIVNNTPNNPPPPPPAQQVPIVLNNQAPAPVIVNPPIQQQQRPSTPQYQVIPPQQPLQLQAPPPVRVQAPASPPPQPNDQQMRSVSTSPLQTLNTQSMSPATSQQAQAMDVIRSLIPVNNNGNVSEPQSSQRRQAQQPPQQQVQQIQQQQLVAPQQQQRIQQPVIPQIELQPPSQNLPRINYPSSRSEGSSSGSYNLGVLYRSPNPPNVLLIEGVGMGTKRQISQVSSQASSHNPRPIQMLRTDNEEQGEPSRINLTAGERAELRTMATNLITRIGGRFQQYSNQPINTLSGRRQQFINQRLQQFREDEIGQGLYDRETQHFLNTLQTLRLPQNQLQGILREAQRNTDIHLTTNILNGIISQLFQ